MTPLMAYVLCSGFVGFLILLTIVFEQTDRGRRFATRAIRWLLR